MLELNNKNSRNPDISSTSEDFLTKKNVTNLRIINSDWLLGLNDKNSRNPDISPSTGFLQILWGFFTKSYHDHYITDYKL